MGVNENLLPTSNPCRKSSILATPGGHSGQHCRCEVTTHLERPTQSRREIAVSDVKM